MKNQDDNKVFEQQELCIQDEAPYCNDVCPLGVDARAMVRLIGNDKLETAYSEYRKRVIFPQIIARTCHAPCQKVCPRKDVEASIQIRLLELACAEHGHKPAPGFFIPPKEGTAHIIGSSLTGLACAHTLARKGFTVNLYEKTNQLGGSLWALIEPQDEAVIAADIAQALKFSKLHVQLETAITSFEGMENGCILLACNSLEPLETEHVFSISDYLGSSASPADEVAAGKLIASHMESRLKGEPLINPTSSDPSRLLIPLANLSKKIDPVRPMSGASFTRAEAVAEAGRCFQCQCLACLEACLLLKRGGGYPKTYINHAQQSLKTIDHIHRKMAARRTNACNLCGLCKEMCPTGLDMGEVYLKSRRIMHVNGELPEAFHEFWLRDLAFSQSAEIFLSRPQPGHERADWLFFPGCQMGGSRQEYVIETYRFLTKALSGGVALQLGCCGAPSEWAGYTEMTEPILTDFQSRWEKLGCPRVILACPSCEKIFKAHHPGISTISLWVLLEKEFLLKQTSAGAGTRVALFDPCSSRHNPEERQSVRNLLTALGYQVEELPRHGRYAQCCGYGGLIYASNPELAQDIRNDRIADSELPYVTYCVNCRETFASGSKPVWHMLDILFGHDNAERAGEKPPDWSTRRSNRIGLKTRLLKEFWEEDFQPDHLPYKDISLIIDEELQARMERELIMIDDIKRIIYEAESSNQKLAYENGRFIGNLIVGYNTYWAEYQPEGKDYRLYNAYTHRMRIKGHENV